jgi:peptidoglycan-associated lipoprotein
MIRSLKLPSLLARLFLVPAVASVVVGSLAVTACGPKKPADTAPVLTPDPAKVPPPGASAAQDVKPGPGVESTNLRVSNEIARLCNLPKVSETAPNFDFNSTDISPQDKEVLAAVAKCLIDGPLRGRKITLVGRADNRGESEYNMGLGGSRADGVRRYLKQLGVEETRVGTTSRGELDATGTDEAGWAKDRRVDIELVS